MTSPLADLPLPAPYAASLRPGTSETLVIAFSSIGHDPDRMPEPEFRRIAPGTDRPALFFRDAGRSWASAPGWAEALQQAVAAAAARQRFARIVTLGVSMGAVAALRAVELLPVAAVLAIGPQSDASGDARWRSWTTRQAIPPCPLPQGPWIVLAHGLHDDAGQAAGFAPRKGVDHLLFAGQGHASLAPHLKRHGLQGMVDALAEGDRRRLLRIATAAGGARRQLPR